MLARARVQGIVARWFAGDEVYGGRELRCEARRLGFDYALAVRADHHVTTACGRFTAAELAQLVPKKAWMRMRTGHGLKGDRHYDWALVDVHPDDTPDGHEAGHAFLVIRRHRYTGEVSFYRCHSANPVTLATLVEVICHRWKIEEDFQLHKGTCGLDQGQTTCWNSWMRWTLISMLAAAVLTVTRVRTAAASPTGPAGIVTASARELLRILRATVLPAPCRDYDQYCTGPPGVAAISIRPPRPTATGTTSPQPQRLDQQQCPTDQELQLPFLTLQL
ncbi:SRSO17 transposase [Streptomyces sp. V4I8]|uniref:hypothetical protein n=1 Tax=Streptomyces sp. V4I8 TaxID=3156469 RepID=UPI0035143B4E